MSNNIMASTYLPLSVKNLFQWVYVVIRYYEILYILLSISIYVMGLTPIFFFLYKHNHMCSMYTRNLPYSFFFFNVVSVFLLVNPLFTGIFQPPPHCFARASTAADSPESPSKYRRSRRRRCCRKRCRSLHHCCCRQLTSDWICPYHLWLIPFPLPLSLPLWLLPLPLFRISLFILIISMFISSLTNWMEPIMTLEPQILSNGLRVKVILIILPVPMLLKMRFFIG